VKLLQRIVKFMQFMVNHQDLSSLGYFGKNVGKFGVNVGKIAVMMSEVGPRCWPWSLRSLVHPVYGIVHRYSCMSTAKQSKVLPNAPQKDTKFYRKPRTFMQNPTAQIPPKTADNFTENRKVCTELSWS
jgi:hypothetical protein